MTTEVGTAATIQDNPVVDERDEAIVRLEQRMEQQDADLKKLQAKQARSEGPRFVKPMTPAHEVFILTGLTAEECELAATDGVPHDRNLDRRLSMSLGDLRQWASHKGIKTDNSPASQFARLLERRVSHGENRQAAARQILGTHKNGRELYAAWLRQMWPDCPISISGQLSIAEACRLLEISRKELGGFVSSTRGPDHVDCLDLAHTLYWRRESHKIE